MKERLVLGAASALLMAGCADNASMYEEERIEGCVSEYVRDQGPEARALGERAVAAATELATTVDLPESNEVAEYLVYGTTLASEDTEKLEIIGLNSMQTYNCLPLDSLARAPIFGGYHIQEEMIALIDSGEPISDFMLGFIMLHEGKHALDILQEGDDVVEAERQARLYEQKILQEYGGEPYQRYLTELKQRIVDLDLLDAPVSLVATEVNVKDVEAIFGPTTSKMDELAKSYTIAINALYELIAEQNTATDTKNQQRKLVNGLGS